MDKRALLAVALSCSIYIAWLIFFAPRPPAVNPASQASTAPSAAGPTEGEAGKELAAGGAAAAESSRTGSHEAVAGDERASVAPRREAAEDAPPAVIDTDVARIEIREPGARIASWRLKKYLDHHDRPYEMISQDAPAATVFPLGFELEDKSLQGLLNGKARFDVERRAVAEAPAPSAGPGAVQPEAETRPSRGGPRAARTPRSERGRPPGTCGRRKRQQGAL
jgi:YidC/Oxa1 family membrane protein insertase